MSDTNITNAAIFLVSVTGAKSRVLLMRETGKPQPDGTREWSTPGGKLNTGEGIFDGAMRELEEETGLVVTKVEDKNDLFLITDGEMGETVKVQGPYPLNRSTVGYVIVVATHLAIEKSKEHDEFHWATLDSVYNGSFEKGAVASKPRPLRWYAKQSFDRLGELLSEPNKLQ